MTDVKKFTDIGAIKIHSVRMKRNLIFLFIILPVFCFFGNQPVQAQVQLERISVTERSDGRGYVIRNHLTAQPDSFRVSHPDYNRVQFLMYAEDLQSDNFQRPEPFTGLYEFRYYTSEGYFGYEIIFEEESLYRPFVYFDVNQTDVLINLERSTREALMATGMTAAVTISQEDRIVETISTDEGAEILPDSDVARGRDTFGDRSADPVGPFRTMIGLKGGHTSANFYGAGYDRSSRTGISVATSVVIDFPLNLPYGITPGIETGIYYMQKGFDEPVTDKFIADRVEIDYIEIPLLVKLNYERENRFSPHLLFGPYLSFMVSSERVFGENESRRDLDDITRNTDLGWAFGAGLDISLGNVILDIQLRNSLSFDTLFNDEEFDDGEKLRQFSLLLGIRF